MVDFDTFNNKYANLTKKQREIFDYIISNPDDVCYLSLKELSKRAGASEVSVLKVCKELGFENYIGLKKAFQSHEQLFTVSEIENLVRQNSDGSKEQKKEFFKIICNMEQRKLTDLISNMNTDLIFKCAEELLKANEVIIFGHNASKTLADYLAYRLNYLRVKAFSIKLGDNDLVKTALVRMDTSDIVVFFSFPPYHYPTTEVVKFAQLKGARIITITDGLSSPAVAEDGYTFICKTAAPFFYNTLSMPMKYIELLASSIAIQLGEQLDRIIKEELMVSKFISENT